jgi:uncharacterized protein
MDKKAALEIIAKFQKSLESKGLRIAKLVLFGSYATGKQHEWSDIDLVVVSEDFVGKDFWQRICILSDAIYETRAVPIEAVALTPAEWEAGDILIVDCAKDGEVVYAAA